VNGIARGLLLHPKALDEDGLAVLRSALPRLEDRFAALWPHASVGLSLSVDDFRRYFPSAGSFDDWALGVVHRQDSLTGRPFFSFLACPFIQMGKLNQQIVRSFLSAKRPAFLVTASALEPVADVRCTDPEDWASGWRLTT